MGSPIKGLLFLLNDMKQEIQNWILTIGITGSITILGIILTWIANYLGKKIEKTIEVNDRLLISVAEIKKDMAIAFEKLNDNKNMYIDHEKRISELEKKIK